MLRDCDVCGGRYPAKRKTSRYCSDRCRKRAQRAPTPPPARALSAVPPLPREQLEDGPLSQITVKTLQEAGRDHTSLGVLAVLLARRLESSTTDTGSSIAALMREYRTVMEAALDGFNREVSPLDRIRAERNLRAVNEGNAPTYYDPRA